MEENIENKGIVKIFVLNTIIEFVLTIIMLFILSLLLSMTDLEEKVIEPSIIGITTFAILIGSFNISRKVKNKGFFIGIIQGIIYMLVLYLLSSFVSMDFSLGLRSLTMIGLGIFGGAIGGIVGVNLK